MTEKVWKSSFVSGSLADCGLPKHVLFEKPFQVALENSQQAIISCAGLEIRVNEDELETILDSYDEESLRDWARVTVCERYKHIVVAYGNLPSAAGVAVVTDSAEQAITKATAVRKVNRANMERMHSILIPEVAEVEIADKMGDRLEIYVINLTAFCYQNQTWREQISQGF